MLKRDSMTREEIVAFFKLNILDDYLYKSCYSQDYADGVNDTLKHLIDEIGDPNLAYNTETGFFDYIGPILPR